MKSNFCLRLSLGFFTLTAWLAGSRAISQTVVPATDPVLAQGHYIFNLGGCVNCHTTDKAKPLAGGLKINSPFGDFYVPNISPDAETGIGSWTEQQFIKALRKGVNPDGKYYYPSFPYTNYTRLSNEDLHALWVYIKTQPPIKQANKPHELSFPYNDRDILLFWRLLNFDQFFNHVGWADYFARGTGHYNPDPSRSDSWNRGAYLVEGPMHCASCHTPRDDFGGLRSNMWMAGGPLYGTKDKAPNITPDKETGVGTWTAEDWDTLFTQGLDDQGDPVGGDMKLVIFNQTSKLSPADRKAVIEYMQSLSPVKNKIDN
jgi:mono/diheme cytochrome c family protein